MPKPYLAVGEEHLHVLRTDQRGWNVMLRALHLLASDPSGLGPDMADQQVCDAEEMLVEMDDKHDDQSIRDTIREERELARDRAVDEMTADILIANLRREHADLVEAAETEERLIREKAEDEAAYTGPLGTTESRQHLTDERASLKGRRGSVPNRPPA